LQTSQGYIILILQHFATKLWNITNFVMLFQAVMKFLSRSKFSLLRKWSIGIVEKRLKFLQNVRAPFLATGMHAHSVADIKGE
jgi:valyl-tRNA synthetase